MNRSLRALTASMFLVSFGLILMELLLTRLFAVVLFAQFAHLALALALLGISLGAVAQHLRPSLLPEEGLERRLGWVVLVQGLLTLVAVWCCVEFPLTVQFEEPPTTYQERSHIKDDLLDPFWFGLLLPVLTAPFAAAGLAFAGTFQRRRLHIGQLYGADLIGGAIGAVLFIPLLNVLAGPDVVFVIGGALAGAAWGLFRVAGSATPGRVSGGIALVCAVLAAVSATGTDVISVRYSAGYAEENVVYSEWTALTRVSVHVDEHRGAIALLDNSSASEIFETEARREEVATTMTNRALVYRVHDPPARVAILAASAGPEVAVAQYYGFTDIDAVDIAGEIFDVVADRFPDSPVNPYLIGDTRRIKSDGRAAILHAEAPYDIIQMVHANLWSSAGLISNAWSPSLLETVEAFETYLDQLTPDGTISFGRGKSTDAIARAAAEALERRGVTEPWRHMFYGSAGTSILLVKKRPWTQAERDRAFDALHEYRRPRIKIDPMAEPSQELIRLLTASSLMTDDRPYQDNPQLIRQHLRSASKKLKGEGDKPLAVLYRSIVIQSVFVLVAGVLFVLLPMLRRGPSQLGGLRGVGPGLLYVCCLGYGYLAVEIVLIHELVLFVGHPTYAVTAVILAMLLSSGIGSVVSERIPVERATAALRGIIAGVLVLGAIQAFAVPPLLHDLALGWPLPLRIGVTIGALLPLGFLMGMPFPLAMRALDERAGGMVPWAWALNGWMSVIASLVTVVISRIEGYSVALAVALSAYVLALLLAGSIRKIRPRS